MKFAAARSPRPRRIDLGADASALSKQLTMRPLDTSSNSVGALIHLIRRGPFYTDQLDDKD
jgi:hypothetical protein